ncbi:VCBS domain-containing protein, partial [Legionella tunisiensis]|uniref:VCBS domain-containing protein n=1 Tax=Legionella tunisiensis TaxID=1034944 RepID=UPI0005936A98
MSKTVPGIVDSLNGLLIKNDVGGQLSIAKNGTQVMKGEQLFLLSGDALLHAIGLGDLKLTVNTPFNLDGISPLLKNLSQSTKEDIENLLQKAVDNGIDPVALLETLEETAAGEGPVLGSGGSTFVYEPTYGAGSVTAGFDTFSANIQELNATETPHVLLPPNQEDILGEAIPVGNIAPIGVATNIPALISSANVVLAQTSLPLSANGKLLSQDVDNPSNIFVAQKNVVGKYGTFSIDENGIWTYQAKESFAYLRDDQNISETFKVASIDGTSGTVTVTIQGINDIPILGGISVGTVKEDNLVVNGNLTKNGKLTITDVDTDQSEYQPQASVAGTYGTFTLSADGTWTYMASNSNPAVQSLGASQSVIDSFVAVSSDGSASQVVTVTIQGTNDIPTIAGTSAAV